MIPLPKPAPANELDELTLARAKRREPAACRALVIFYQRQVHQVIWRMLDPAGLGSQADDVTQETFVRVFGALA